jgi:hypothetical protein
MHEVGRSWGAGVRSETDSRLPPPFFMTPDHATFLSQHDR